MITRFLFLFFVLLLWPQPVQALAITEVAYDVAGADTKHEWLELHNNTDQPLDLTGYLFVDDSNHQLAVPPAKGGQGSLVLATGAYLVIADDAATFLADHPAFTAAVIDSVVSLPNYSAKVGSTSLQILDTTKQVVASLSYQPTVKGSQGHTYELQADGSWSDSNAVGGSPGGPALVVPPVVYSKAIQFSEVVSNPDGSDQGQEWVELYSNDQAAVDLTGWSVSDGSSQELLNGLIAPGAYSQFRLAKLSLGNQAGETLALLSPNQEVIDTLQLPAMTKEGLAYARFTDGWQLTSQPTAGAPNVWLALPTSSPKAKRSSPSPAKVKVSPRQTVTVGRTPASVITRTSPSPQRASSSPIFRPTVRPSLSPPKKQLPAAQPTPKPSPSPRPTRSPVAVSSVQSVAGLAVERPPSRNRWLQIGLLIVSLIGLGLYLARRPLVRYLQGCWSKISVIP